MGRITVEVSNDIGIKLPEACPLHKHKISFYGSGDSIINYNYYKHRVGTDDEYTDGQQYHDCGNFLVPDGLKITTVTNGTRSGGDNNSRTGTVHINSNKVTTFDGINQVEVRVNLADIDWVRNGYARYGVEAWADEDKTTYHVSWDTESAVYREIYKPYYEDRDYPLDISKIDSSADSIYGDWHSYSFPKNDDEDSNAYRYSPLGDFVIQAPKPVTYTVNGALRSGTKGSTDYETYSKSNYKSVTATNATVSDLGTYWKVSWEVSKGLKVTITATPK